MGNSTIRGMIQRGQGHIIFLWYISIGAKAQLFLASTCCLDYEIAQKNNFFHNGVKKIRSQVHDLSNYDF